MVESADTSISSDDDLLQRLRRVRGRSVAIAAPLEPEDQCIQTMPDVSPTKWHLAHTTWFFETFVLEQAEPDFEPHHPQFRVLFNSYYNGVGEQFHRPHRGLLSRPTVKEVMAYRAAVDERLVRALDGGMPASLRTLVELGLHHEQQHQELMLTDIKHVLAFNPLRPSYREDLRPPQTRPDVPAPTWFEHAGGLVSIGRDASQPDFAYDNEGPRHRVFVEPFALAERLVTNDEYLAFVQDGGYTTPSLWLSDGWAAIQGRNGESPWRAPLYWFERDGAWFEFTLGGPRPLNLAAPVCHVSQYEADAFAQWAGARLPTEAEWELVAAEEAIEGNFVDSDTLHPTAAPANAERTSPLQLFGDVWEWTRSAYLPYPGYAPPSGAVGEYNGKFMSGQMTLRGGSCATPADHIRATYRNFFPAHTRWQFSGMRLCKDMA